MTFPKKKDVSLRFKARDWRYFVSTIGVLSLMIFVPIKGRHWAKAGSRGLWYLALGIISSLISHDANFLDMPEDFVRPILLLDRWLIRRCAEASRLVLTVSEFSRGRIVDGLGLSPERVLATSEAASPEFARPRKRAQRMPFLLYVANTYAHKNASRLVRAFGRIADRIPQDLIIVGQKHRGEPARHPRVHRLHRVPFEELVGLYQSCDLFVFPSRYEGFGLPVLEALRAGARVAVARAAAIPEVAGDAATYFDPLDEGAMAATILEVLGESRDRRARFRALGRERDRRFSWERCASETLDGFRWAIGSPGSAVARGAGG